jgi:hypothetical protein
MSEEEAKTETPPATVETEEKVEEEEAPKEQPKEEESTATFEPVVSVRCRHARIA